MKQTVFFYGLFMDASLLNSFGIEANNIKTAQLPNYRLHIGERATLIPEEGCVSYGLVMDIDQQELKRLYQMDGVQDYEPVPIHVVTDKDQSIEAKTYLLQEGLVSGTNSEYAKKLISVAESVGLPETAIKDIKTWV